MLWISKWSFLLLIRQRPAPSWRLVLLCRMALKPDGLFLASMYGGDTLRELRIACTAAQLEREGGVSPRISPLAQVRDAGNLLTRAGLALPTVDVDEYTVNYPSVTNMDCTYHHSGSSFYMLLAFFWLSLSFIFLNQSFMTAKAITVELFSR
ncbi:hypothetical protein O6H91_11G091200 [Diphasiastrum complanatum]|uniref:Uncharacterized protein n=1 Tax=Diphasiastrum complanatum TaxID=34168 RepID=A0ACC2CBL2_DIPCM|nr:hypothetical protein O6H91_11G091200 [Diphasiastrum complanatum]